MTGRVDKRCPYHDKPVVKVEMWPRWGPFCAVCWLRVAAARPEVWRRLRQLTEQRPDDEGGER